MTRQLRATSPWRGSHARRNFTPPSHPFLLDDGPVAGGRGQLGDADVVAVVEGRAARGRVVEVRRGRGGGQLAGELGGALAGIIFGLGMALGAANFIAWLF